MSAMSSAAKETVAGRARAMLGSRVASVVAILIAILWTIPTLGLFITSLRPPVATNRTGWWTVFTPGGLSQYPLSFDNYHTVLTGEGSTNLTKYFVNTIVITVPAVLLPILLATLAAYALAWIDFPGRDWLFVAIFSLQVVPLQVALIPLLSLYTQQLHFEGTFWSAWISHTIFALPLAIFLLHNFVKDIPAELIEAARVDGAGHVRIFFRIMLPLLTPALASFGIFQFLWVWNDLLVAKVFLGSSPDVAPLTSAVLNLSGSRGSSWYLVSAGAFVSMIVPVAVFLGLQRFFVRGLLAGGLKG
jgi:alpha-glucoside transport system permease protein